MSDEFERKDNHCTDRIDDSWRKPRGSDNKQRLGKKGHPKAVDTGYRTEKSERHKWNGKEVITVESKDEIEMIDSDDEAARIPSMGRRKKTPLVQHAVDNDVDVVNLDEAQYIEQTEDFLEAREERQKQRAAEAAAKAAAEEEEEDEEDETSEDDEPSEEDTDEDTDTADDSESAEATSEAEDSGDGQDEASDDAPTSNNTVDEIKAWLDDNDIEYTSSMLKDDLLGLVDEHTEDES